MLLSKNDRSTLIGNALSSIMAGARYSRPQPHVSIEIESKFLVQWRESMLWMRLIFLCLVCPLIIWLSLDASPFEKRASSINRALLRGGLGGLTPKETTDLSNLFIELSQIAGVSDPVILNQPLRVKTNRNTIHIFTSISEYYGNIKKGNAIYDGAVDAIIIDLNVVRLPPVTKLYADMRVSDRFLRISYDYLSFVFLHELGHRSLHRHKQTQLDFGATFTRAGSQYEKEADAFALNALHKYYRMTGSIGRSDKTDLKESTNKNDFEDALANMIRSTINSLLFSSIAYSPFYQGDDHPTFLSRSLGFLSTMTDINGLESSAIRAAYQELIRINDAAASRIFEIQTPSAISTINILNNELVFFGENGKLYSTSLNELSIFYEARTQRHGVAQAPEMLHVPINGPDAYRDNRIKGAGEYFSNTGEYTVNYYLDSDTVTDTKYKVCLERNGQSFSEVVACYPLVAYFVPEGVGGYGWPAGEVLLRKRQWITKDKLLVDLHGDSIYLFDLRNKQASILFHPGGLRSFVLESGYVVLYAAGGSKAFVLRP